MINERVKSAKQSAFVIVFLYDSGDIGCSEVFSDYDDAVRFTTDENGANGYKAIIVGAGSMCGMQEFEMQIEKHT